MSIILFRLIVIKYGDLPAKEDMGEAISNYVKTYTYLDAEDERQGRMKKPKN